MSGVVLRTETELFDKPFFAAVYAFCSRIIVAEFLAVEVGNFGDFRNLFGELLRNVRRFAYILGKFVDVGSFVAFRPVTAYIAVSEVVYVDNDYVWLFH